MKIEDDIRGFREKITAVRQAIASRVVGQNDIVDQMLVCLLTGGHALIEGVPGLGKTYIIRTLSSVLDLVSRRVQFTPDLMPADIIGTNVLAETDSGATRVMFQQGPLFANIVLADEINRATPKTQSALLEAMQEARVTVSGTTHELTLPFMVLATQNPLEMEGTYPLPEAQLYRFFFKLLIDYPDSTEMLEILNRTTGTPAGPPEPVMNAADVVALQTLVRQVPASEEAMRLAVLIVGATHPGGASELATRFVRYGASPRGAQALVLAAKVYALFEDRVAVAFDDVRKAALPALRHRIILSFQGEAEGITTDHVISDILAKIPDLGA